jgi:hypothetical protein
MPLPAASQVRLNAFDQCDRDVVAIDTFKESEETRFGGPALFKHPINDRGHAADNFSGL